MIQRKSKDIIIWMFSNKTVVKNLHNTSEKGSYLFQCCIKFSISRWDQRRKVILTSASLVSTTFIIFRYAVSRSVIREGSSDSTKRNSKLIRFIIKIVKLKKNIKQTKKPTKNKKAKKKNSFCIISLESWTRIYVHVNEWESGVDGWNFHFSGVAKVINTLLI